MGCFMSRKGNWYITLYEGMEEDFLTVGHAVVDVRDHYVKLSPITTGHTFNPLKHYLIYKGERQTSYCDLCHNRTRALTGFCSPCLFVPLGYGDPPSMDMAPLLARLREKSFIEMDRPNFHHYITYGRQNTP